MIIIVDNQLLIHIVTMDNVHVLKVTYRWIFTRVVKVYEVTWFRRKSHSDLLLDTNRERTASSTSYKSLLGGACHTNRNCQTAEAICLNNICTCPNNYFPIDDWNCLSDSGMNATR